MRSAVRRMCERLGKGEHPLPLEHVLLQDRLAVWEIFVVAREISVRWSFLRTF